MQLEQIKKLSPRQLFEFATDENSTIEFKQNDIKPIERRREKLLIQAKKEKIYGVNTGFGFLSEKRIPNSQLVELQKRLIQSHATGIGPKLSDEVVRAMLLLRILNLFKPESCASTPMIERAVDCYNAGILPLIPEMGSVGASGDLAPLAHLACIFTTDGKGTKFKSGKVAPLKSLIKKPVKLGPKDGLAFINGVQGMLSVSLSNLTRAQNLLSMANLVSCASLDAYMGTISAFDARLFESRPHAGMKAVSKHLMQVMKNSQILESHKNCGRTQDPYSFRCIPQVHGSLYSVLKHVEDILDMDLNSATDNPLVYEEGRHLITLSGGNFHGMPIALAQDYMASALASVANISERRMEKLINPALSGLPAFLSKDPGINSGMMIVHVSAAALCNRIKTLCFPASCDTIPTSADKEDHVSMGMNSALKVKELITLFSHTIALEALVACQGLEFRRPLKSSKPVEWLYEQVRAHVTPMNEDHFLGEEIEHLTTNFESIAAKNHWNMF